MAFKKGHASCGWWKGKKMSKAQKRKYSSGDIPRNKGKPVPEETRAKMSLGQRKYWSGIPVEKRRTPWNRGIRAWNNGLEWPEEVKENISNGMIAYWIERKES